MQNLILECAIRASLIAICTGALLHILRVKTARVRHTVWASVVVLMLALPVWTAWGPRAVLRVLDTDATPTVNRSTISTEIISSQALPAAFPVETAKPIVRSMVWTWRNYLAGVYLMGLCALLARLAIGTVRAHMLVRRAANREGRLTSGSCAVPVTVGCLKPTVILPEYWGRWPQAQLNAVLTHEDEHARRRDPLVQWLAMLNRAVFWFHPLAWWLERRLSALAEEACDAAVLARGHDPFQYSEYLLEIARVVQQTGARVNVMGMAMPGAFLPQRIRRIVEGRPAQRISGVRMACVAVACAVVSAVFTAGAVGYAHVQTDRRTVTGAGSLEMPTPALAMKLSAIEHPSPRPVERPKVLLAQAQTSPVRPNSSAANSTSPDSGSIAGTVEDPSGGRVPQCVITVRDQSGASVASGASNAAGLYQLGPLPPGHYSVAYNAPGFARLRMEAVIEAGNLARIDAKLELGQVSEVMTVTGRRPAAAPAPATAQLAAGPINVGGRVQAVRLLVQTKPVYPPELEQQGLEGTVLIRAVISKDGMPLDLHVVNTDEVDGRFAQAALDSVRQWRYQPGLLNGNPVETLTTVSVNFRLSQ